MQDPDARFTWLIDIALVVSAVFLASILVGLFLLARWWFL